MLCVGIDGQSLKFAFQTVKDLPDRFGKSQREPVLSYRRFMLQGVGTSDADDFTRALRRNSEGAQCIPNPGCWVIGDPEFVKKSMAHDAENRLRISRYQREGWNLEQLGGVVSRKMGVTPGDIKKRGRVNRRSEARKVLAAIAHRRLGVPIVDIARYLGTTGSAVSHSLDEGERRAMLAGVSIVI